MKEMAGVEVEGLVYGGPHGPGRAGWLPVNTESNNPPLSQGLTLVNNSPLTFVDNPSLTLVDNPPITEPLTQGLDFPYFEPQQKEVNGDWVSRPIYPWQETNSILERQQEGGIFPSIQLSPRDIALGGIALSLLVTAVIGWILAQPIINWRGGEGKGV